MGTRMTQRQLPHQKPTSTWKHTTKEEAPPLSNCHCLTWEVAVFGICMGECFGSEEIRAHRLLSKLKGP